MKFLEVTIRHLPTYQSNHNPILIYPEGGFVPSLHAVWLLYKEFEDFVQNIQDLSVHIDIAIKNFSREVKLWNIKFLRYIFTKKKKLMARLGGVQ